MDRPTTAPAFPPTFTCATTAGCVGGEPIDGLYVEQFWLSRIGPTPLWLARFVVRHHDTTWRLDDVAAALGVRSRVILHAALRLDRYRMATWTPHGHGGTLTVDRAVRPLGGTDVDRLPAGLRHAMAVAS